MDLSKERRDRVKQKLKSEGFGFVLRKGREKLFGGNPSEAEQKRRQEIRDREYALWREKQLPSMEEIEKQKQYVPAKPFNVSFLMPVYRPRKEHIQAMVESIEAQTLSTWEICIACADAGSEETKTYLEEAAAKDSRIHVKFLEANEGISGNTNAAWDMASGNWLAFVDQDDFLREDALYRYALAAEDPRTDMIYCDEDKWDEETGKYFEPHFKSDFNQDLLCCNNYICHMVMVKRELAEKAGRLDPSYDGAQDHDFNLRVSELAQKIVHIPRILYSWRCHRLSTASNPESKRYAFEAGKRAIEAHYARIGVPGTVEIMAPMGWYRTNFTLTQKPLVSLLIPNMDHGEDLRRCIRSLKEKLIYPNLEILVLENNSKNKETFALYEELQKEDPRIRVLYWKKEFNYSAINNFGAEEAKGEYLWLLNNDTEVISPDLLDSMLGYAMRKDVGIVGPKLLYADDTVQHAGVLVGVSEGADHIFLRAARNDPGYMGRAMVSQDYSAVTAASLLVSREIYREVGGMEEAFQVAYNDVDFCMKVRKAGYLVVWDAFAEMYHYESISRGYEQTEAQKKRFAGEMKLLQERWPEQMKNGDPYYNPNVGLKNGYFGIEQ